MNMLDGLYIKPGTIDLRGPGGQYKRLAYVYNEVIISRYVDARAELVVELFSNAALHFNLGWTDPRMEQIYHQLTQHFNSKVSFRYVIGKEDRFVMEWIDNPYNNCRVVRMRDNLTGLSVDVGVDITSSQDQEATVSRLVKQFRIYHQNKYRSLILPPHLVGSGVLPPLSYAQEARRLKDVVPGLGELTRCPVTHENSMSSWNKPANTVFNVVIHLNDDHHWTREQIADWLDTLDVDLSFPTPDLTDAT